MRYGISIAPSTSGRRRFVQATLATLLAVTGMAFHAHKVSASEVFDELRVRIEKLEKENRVLRADMESSVTSANFDEMPPPPPGAAFFADPYDSAAQEEPESDDDRRINSLIENYLRRHPVAAPRDDHAQDSKLSAVESKIAGVLERLNKKTYPTIQMNGAFQADTGFFMQDANSLLSYGHIANGADFRRARLGAKGAINENVNYAFQMDFAFFGRPTFTDVYVEQTNIPYLGTVRIGQWKQPFSLEVTSSYRYTTFMERSLLFQPFDAFRRLGIGFYDNAEDLSATWAASVFASGQDQFGNTLFQNQTSSGLFTNTNMGGVGSAERFTWVPYWDEASKGTDYLHLGVGHYFNAPPGQTTSFRTIPELYIGQSANVVSGGSSFQPVPGGANGTPFFVNTGALPVNFFNVLGTELLWVRGPLSVQSEGMVNLVTQSGTTAVLPGFYTQVGYFLTGEHRPYDRKLGQIDRVIPFKNFSFTKDGCNTGMGAWEIAGRISHLDLNDKSIQGGTITDYTAGLNWYVNPNVKLVLNYIHSSSNYAGVGGAAPVAGAVSRRNETDMIAARCQMDF
ncbi:OprO/OprP family phosphate-selective porin [Schlesneria sp.]|uniref:OprO/OprP family phosphate-selective porin n=1 Tax=Schlesneria sp. TaxID=2762018 RepID=UPI002F01378A